MTVKEISCDQAIYHIVDRSPEQMLKAISTLSKLQPVGELATAAKLPTRIAEVEEFGGIAGVIASLPIRKEGQKQAMHVLLNYQVRTDKTVLSGGQESWANATRRTAERIDELADRF